MEKYLRQNPVLQILKSWKIDSHYGEIFKMKSSPINGGQSKNREKGEHENRKKAIEKG
jgi:hypothetical protein